MNKIKLFKIVLKTVFTLLPSAVFAQSYIPVAEIPNPLGQGTSISGLINNIVDFIFNLGLALSVVVFLIGGFQYLFSFGSERKVEQAHKTLWYGVIGATVMLAGKSITNLIVSIL